MTSRSSLRRGRTGIVQWFAGALVVIVFCPASFAGGPKYVAGASYFNSSVMGVPVTWAQGLPTYYTDQGSLSSILSNSMADAYVADASHGGMP